MSRGLFPSFADNRLPAGTRLTFMLAHPLHELGARWGLSSACVGGGKGIALRVENPNAA